MRLRVHTRFEENPNEYEHAKKANSIVRVKAIIGWLNQSINVTNVVPRQKISKIVTSL